MDSVSGRGMDRPENRSVSGRKGRVLGQMAPWPARDPDSPSTSPLAACFPASDQLCCWLLTEWRGLVGKAPGWELGSEEGCRLGL